MLGLNDEHIAHRDLPLGDFGGWSREVRLPIRARSGSLISSSSLDDLSSTAMAARGLRAGSTARAHPGAHRHRQAATRLWQRVRAAHGRDREGTWFNLLVRRDAGRVLAQTREAAPSLNGAGARAGRSPGAAASRRPPTPSSRPTRRRSTPTPASSPYDIAASIAHARMLGRQRIIPKKDADAIVRGLDGDPRRVRARRLRAARRPRRRAHERRGAAGREDRRRRRAPAHGALAQRPGRDRLPPVREATPARRGDRALLDAAVGARRPGGGEQARRHARLHAPAARAARAARAPPARLLRDVRARLRALRRRATR